MATFVAVPIVDEFGRYLSTVVSEVKDEETCVFCGAPLPQGSSRDYCRSCAQTEGQE